LREKKMRIINVAVTQGSKRERRAGRLEELRAACAWLGFEVVTTAEGGLEDINLKGRKANPEKWKASRDRIKEIIAEYKPSMMFLPHDSDWNSTHIGTHHLVMEALAAMSSFQCRLVETEFWAPSAKPNLMVEASAEIVADLMAAIACHVKEVERNPYHLTLPAWMQDNVRRGGEVVGGQGGAVPDFKFATLYRVRNWANGNLEDPWEGGRIIGMSDNPAI
jgi:N-acetylglucosamine malate deacetylase 1